MLLTYYGHSAVLLSDGKHTVIVDPYISGNPVAPVKSSEVPKVDYILVTHGHADHFGDAVALGKRDGATIICTWELKNYFEAKGLKVHSLSTGGGHDFPFGRVKATIAFHGCGGDADADGITLPPNSPVGYVITIGKKNIYHAGDTALFSDMKLIGERYKIDCACVPIGDNFTMGPDDAALAVDFVKAERVVPIHYDTWDVIHVDTRIFQYKIEKQGRKAYCLKPGEAIDIS